MPKLDLHKTPHDEVSRLVIRFIEDNWEIYEELDIVTGNSSYMRSIVTSILDEYNLDYTIGGFLGLNRGYIKVIF